MKIKSIKKINNNSKLYDIETKKNHNFFANNVLVHNSNFSVIFYPLYYLNFAKRSGIIESGDNFYNYKEAFQGEEWESFCNAAFEYCSYTGKTIQFVGELYGQGVQKRVWYGPGRYWKWYAVYELLEDDKFKNYNFSEMKDLMENGIKPSKDFFLSPFVIASSLKEALSFDININSSFTPEGYDKKNIMEGIVIRPVNNYFIGSELFILKLKNKEFQDNHAPRERKVFNIKEDLQTLYDKVSIYVNENRTQDLFSKYGIIESMKEFGTYLGYYSKDIHEEIMKYYPLDFENLEKEEKTWLHKQLSNLIKEELMKELQK
jgi:Rnl2 family RNA ligase